MGFKLKAWEAVPKVFQTFNSLLGGIVRKKNATIVGPSKQLVGEFPTVDFERLYQYYHHWDQIKTAVDVMHQKFRGSGIEIKSNNEYFNNFIKRWWDVTNSEKKWSQFIYSLLITGSAIMELQYTPSSETGNQRMGNIEQIPMQTIYRLFRDQFGNELKIVQIVDGVFKELDPEFFIHHTINNPDRQAFGKSMYNTLASPRPIVGKNDPFTGEPINAQKNLMPLLDMQAIIQNDEMEIKHKMAKPRLVVGANGMPRDQMEEISAEMADPDNEKWIWFVDKPVNSAELQVQAQGKFDDYAKNIDAHIDVGTIFASNVIKNPQGFSYSGGQTPLDVLDQTMIDLQADLAETMKDRLLKPLAESWGFMEFNEMEVEVNFTAIMKRLTMEDIRGLDPEAISLKEKRAMYKKLNIELDDQLWEAEQEEKKQDVQDQKNIQMQSAMTPAVAGGEEPATGENPFKTAPSGGDEDSGSTAGSVKSPSITPPKADNEKDRPTPTPTTTPQPAFKKPRGETLIDRLVREVANEGGMTIKQKIEALKGLERIPLPPKAGDKSNSSSDLYVSQGIDDASGKPEITDPAVRLEFGLDKDESELPPTDPSKMARGSDGDIPQLNPDENTAGRFTNAGDKGIPQVSEDGTNIVSEDEYEQHANGDAFQGGLGNDGIDEESDGTFKDPQDRNNDMSRTPETGNTDNPMPHAGPNQEPLVDDSKINTPNEMTLKVTGGSDALPDNTNKQVLGANDNDEQPIVPSEGDDQDYDKDELKKKEDSQNLGEANFIGKNPDKNQPQVPEKPEVMHRDIIEGEDPFTSGTGEQENDTDKNLDQIRKPQARLDDAPLQEQPNADSSGTINPNGINPNGIDNINDFNNTAEEQPEELINNDDDTPTDLVPPFDKTSGVVGDSGQVRLQRDEDTGNLQDQPLENNSKSILDNTGLNVEPEIEYNPVTEDDYNAHVQTGENPLEPAGTPLEDGMIIKPEDVQQNDGISGNDMNDPTLTDTTEEEVDPNILHTDPETGINYTDLTDEQGEQVPDVRFDQTPTSDEEQPEIELEYEVVTKEEYDAHAEAGKADMVDALAPTQPMESEVPTEENPLDPTETDEQGNPVELDTDNAGGDPIDNGNGTMSNPNETTDLAQMDNSGGDAPKEGDGQSTPKESSDEPKEKSAPKESEDKEPKKSTSDKPKETTSDEPKEKSKPKKSPKKKSEPKEDKEEPTKDTDKEDEQPKRKGSVKDIIKREHELIDSGIPEEEVHGMLEDEFGEDRIDKAEETKTWKNRRN